MKDTKTAVATCVAVLFAAVAAFADDASKLKPIVHHIAAPREYVDLGGEWEMAKYPNKVETYKDADGKDARRIIDPALSEVLAKAQKWTKVTVPGIHEPGNDKQNVYLKRTVDIPGAWIGRRLKLHFERNYQTFLVAVNGVDCGKYRTWGVPTDVDITKGVKAGANEIVVTIWNDGARRDWKSACDWRPGWSDGQCGIRLPVHLEVMDKVYIADVIQSAVVNPTNAAGNVFNAIVVVKNDTDAAREVEVKAEVKGEWTAAPQKVTVPAHGAAEAKISQVWPGVRYWTPDTPNLYFCDVSLAERATPLQGAGNAGESLAPRAVDAFRRRFGFCQVTIAKDRLLFNGNPVMLRRGSSGEGAYDKGDKFRIFAQNRRNGSVGARLWNNWERACDAADEFGYFFTPVASQGWGSANRDQEKFWPVYEQHLKEFVEALRHHPCILYWCASNEFGTIYGGNEGGPKEGPTQKNQVRVQSKITVFDRGGARPWEACGEVEVGYPVKGNHGPAPIRSYHYPISYCGDGNELPEAAYWYDKGSPVPWQRIATRDKPTSISEDLYHGMADQHLGMSRFGGDQIYTPEGYAKAMKWAGTTVAEGLYAAGITTWEPWVFWPDRKNNKLYEGRSIHPDYLVALRDFNRSLRSGVAESRTVYLYNQNFRTVEADFRRTFKMNGHVFAATNEMVKLTPGCKIEQRLVIPTPVVKAPTKIEVEVMLRGPGPHYAFPMLEKRTFEFTVYPEEKAYDGGAKCALVAAADSPLAMRGKWTKGVYALATEAVDSGAKRIVVAKDLTVAEGRALEEFVEDGGRVLILEAGENGWTPIDLVFRRGVSMAFRRDDTAMPGVGEEMMRVWRGDSALGGASYPKPAEDARILWDCGHKDGLDSFMVGWVYRDEGAYLLCQMPVLSRLDSEPAAGFVLKSVLKEFEREIKVPEKSLYFAGGEEMRETLVKAGIPLTDSFRKAGAVWIDVPTNGLDAATRETLEKAVDKEKTVIVSGLRTDNATDLLAKWGLSAFLPLAYESGTHGYRVDTGVQWVTRTDNIGLFAGICNDDLFWRKAVGMDGWGYSCYSEGREPPVIYDRKKGPTMSAAFAVLAADPDSPCRLRTRPATVAEAPLGDEGARIVFTTLDLAGNLPKATAKMSRVIRTWLNNCGVKTSEPKPVVELEPLEIVGSFNRALWHDPLNAKPDGTFEPKGWVEGVDKLNDMRFFPVNLCGWSVAANNMCPREPWPTMPMRLGPVTFRLQIEDPSRTGSKACLVIDPGETLTVTLPKPVKASRLWFLGCCGDPKPLAVEMRVNGTDAPLVFTRGDHFGIYRWNDSVKSGVIGWTGHTMKDSMASLYVWPAENPLPDKEIRTLTFKNTVNPSDPKAANAFVLLGLTAERTVK